MTSMFDPEQFEASTGAVAATETATLPFFGIGGPAHIHIRNNPHPLDTASIERACKLRDKVFSGDHEAIDADDVKMLREADKNPGYGAAVRYSLTGSDGQKRPEAVRAASEWARFLDTIHKMHANPDQDIDLEGEFGDFLAVEDRDFYVPVGPGQAAKINVDDFKRDHAQFVGGPPPPDKLVRWGDTSPLWYMFENGDWPHTGAGLSRAWTIRQAIERGDSHEFIRQDVEHFITLMDKPYGGQGGRGFMPLSDSDMLWSWCATRTWLDWKLEQLKRQGK